ncbi:MAG: AmmeMemoRadiSam system radical SAM enzyme [Acetobacterium sp.]
MSRLICRICPHQCHLDENQIGFCRARSNKEGVIIPINYGLITSMSMDPIEKKPLYQFFPGSQILSVGSFGCNLRCSFCQNYQISMAGCEESQTLRVSPEDLVRQALELKPQGNIGIAFTYNEPLIGFEYVRDCAILAREKGLKNVLVTNGYVCPEPLKEILPLIDALNIDLKGFTEEFYHKVSGDLETVKGSIKLAAENNHIEVTTLIIPGENDSEDEIRNMSQWLASIRPDIPLHLSRFFPCYKMTDRNPTAVASVYALAEIARESLKDVYVGNC